MNLNTRAKIKKRITCRKCGVELDVKEIVRPILVVEGGFLDTGQLCSLCRMKMIKDHRMEPEDD